MSSTSVAGSEQSEGEFDGLQKGLIRTRIQKNSWWIYCTIFYIPIGILLLVVRICISLQAFLLLLLLPNEFPLKRVMLRVMFSTLGIVVLLNNDHRDSSVKVLVANKISLIDHLLCHLVINCISISPRSDHLFAPYLLPHHTLVANDDETWQREASKIILSRQVIAQPEAVPTDGLHILLKYRAWPFVLDEQVQPVVISAFRPLNFAGLNINTVTNTSPLLDLLSCFFSPVTIYKIGYLPVVRQGTDETVRQFADRTQQVVGKAVNLVSTQFDYDDIQKWIGSSDHRVASVTAVNDDVDNSIPFIPISQFNKMIPQIDQHLKTMIRQVSDVLPQVPDHVIQDDLMHTRDVDKTITNILEGRVRYDTVPSSSNVSTSTTQSSNLKNLSFPERKMAFMEEARRRFISKHGH